MFACSLSYGISANDISDLFQLETQELTSVFLFFFYVVKFIIFQLNMTQWFSSSSHYHWFLFNFLLSVNWTLDYLPSPIQMQYRNSWKFDWNVWIFKRMEIPIFIFQTWLRSTIHWLDSISLAFGKYFFPLFPFHFSSYIFRVCFFSYSLLPIKSVTREFLRW